MFGLGFAIIAVDFIMRFLIIEKKTAAQYEEPEEQTNAHTEDEEDIGQVEDGHEATEEEPLLRKEEEDNYKVPPGQNKAIRSFPILYCLKDPRLLVALLVGMSPQFRTFLQFSKA